jgi:hypothetical protein
MQRARIIGPVIQMIAKANSIYASNLQKAITKKPCRLPRPYEKRFLDYQAEEQKKQLLETIKNLRKAIRICVK